MSEQPAAGPPRHDTLAEQAVLGAMLQDISGAVFDEITTILGGSSAFYRGQHAAMYDALLKQRVSGLPIGDPIAFAEQLDDDTTRRIGGAPYIYTCMAAVPTIANGPYYARHVAELALLRDVETFGIKTIHRARQAAPQDALGALEAAQADLAAVTLGGAVDLDVPDWATTQQDVLNEIERIAELKQSKTMPGIPTGWADMDRLLNGLQGGQLILIAGRPGIGKSVAARQIFMNAAELGHDSFLFTLEMSRNECGMALLSAGAGVPLHKIRSGELDDLDWAKLAKYLGRYGEAKAFIDDRPGIGLAHARQVLRRHSARGGKPKLVAWDYAQISAMGSGNGRRDRGREQDVAELVRGFKLLGKEFDIPVVLVSQLNRGPEQRTDKRPQLSDLRESGSLEQDADIVILVHRDDYYDKESPRAGEADFIVAKHRHGSTDTVTVASQLHYQRFVDMAIV